MKTGCVPDYDSHVCRRGSSVFCVRCTDGDLYPQSTGGVAWSTDAQDRCSVRTLFRSYDHHAGDLQWPWKDRVCFFCGNRKYVGNTDPAEPFMRKGLAAGSWCRMVLYDRRQYNQGGALYDKVSCSGKEGKAVETGISLRRET